MKEKSTLDSFLPGKLKNRRGFSSTAIRKFLLMAVMLNASSFVLGQTVVLNPTSPWVVPAGVTSITVMCWGGGGGGGGVYGDALGGGGGGGAGGSSSIVTFNVNPGDSYTITKGGGGAGGSTSGTNGSAGGNSAVSGPGGSCIAYGGPGGDGDDGVGGATTTGAVSGIGGYAGGNGIGQHFEVNNQTGGGGGGGAGNAGPGSPGIRGTGSGPSPGGAGGIGSPNVAPYIGGNGGNSPIVSSGASAGLIGSAPGGGGGGGSNYNSGSGVKGGNGGAGQVIISYNVIPTCTMPCAGWITQNCSTCTKGCYIDAGIITPSATLQTQSTMTDTSNYGYVYWSFNASEGSTYYFDLCSSTGTSGVSWLRLHDTRITNPGNNYCMDALNTPNTILQNMLNGCAGTGIGLSKLIWTCQASGTYYLESAVGANLFPWGISGSQTAILSYKTLPSYSFVCSAVFYDKGIDGINGSSSSYNNNENWIYTYYPVDTIGSAISAQFISFSTSPGDILCVYDGNSINAPIIGCYSGPSITGAFSSTASNGSLTFQFTSDDSLISTGWEANISCVPNIGVGNYVSASRMSIFPNPVKNRLEVSGLKFEITKIQIFNVIGKNVYSQQSGMQFHTSNLKPRTSLDVSDLAPGIYFIQIENEESSWNGRFIKQ